MVIAKKMTDRQVRVAELVRQEVATGITQNVTGNVMLEGIVTVTDVWVSADMRQARVYISAMNSTVDTDMLVQSLNDDAFLFQRVLGGLKMKYTPKLRFFYDDAYEKAATITTRLTQSATASKATMDA